MRIEKIKLKIERGIKRGLRGFVNEYKGKFSTYAQQAEEKYYNDYSSWADQYRLYDLYNMDKVTARVSGTTGKIKIVFSPRTMKGGHGIWRPLSDYAPDPGQVFNWGFETGFHGWYVKRTPIKTYWEQYYSVLKRDAKKRAWAHIKACL